MANEGNLKPYNKRSKNEARENGQKGGIESGKARRRKANLREIAQAVLDGTYKGKSGEEMTGDELVTRSLIANLADAKGKNWGKAMDLLVQLTGASVTKEQQEKTRAETDLLKLKAQEINGAGTQIEDLTPLAEMIAQNGKGTDN